MGRRFGGAQINPEPWGLKQSVKKLQFMAQYLAPNNWRSADSIPRSELVTRLDGRASAVLRGLAKTLERRKDLSRMPRASALYGWLERKSPLPAFVDIQEQPPNVEFGGGIALDIALPAHEAHKAPANSLESSWNDVHKYVQKALALIEADVPGWLDSEEAFMIKDELGEPPTLCYPLYLMSVGDDSEERVVYVGKTSSRQGRFRQGHAALTKLLHPNYDGMSKRVYFGSIVLLSDTKDYYPLEWVRPLEFAKQLLSSIEAQVIYHFAPELNTHHIYHDNVRWKFPSLLVQNFTDETDFLDDEFVLAPTTKL